MIMDIFVFFSFICVACTARARSGDWISIFVDTLLHKEEMYIGELPCCGQKKA